MTCHDFRGIKATWHVAPFLSLSAICGRKAYRAGGGQRRRFKAGKALATKEKPASRGRLTPRDAGLRQNLRLRQLRRGRGEVGVVDLAAGIGNVLQGDTQRIQVRLDDVFL